MADNKTKSLMGVNSDFINRYFANQYGLDIETSGSNVEPGRILQIGIATPSGKSYELNVQQKEYKSSKFHARPGGLDEYYKQQNINPEVTSQFKTVQDRERRYVSAVISKEKAKKLSQNLLKGGNQPANIIIHNANFEIKHFDSFYDGSSPFQFSQAYRELINANAAARMQDEKMFKAGRLSVTQYRANDIARQSAVYDQILIDAQKGGAIIDSMELAKTANALAQGRGLVPATGDLALGTNVELLSKVFLGEKEVHRAVQDVWQQNELAPKLVRLVEKLKRSDFKESMLSAQESAWVNVFRKDHVGLKVESQKKAIMQAIDNLSEGRNHLFRSGQMSTGDINVFLEYLGRSGRYAQISQGIRAVDHGVAPSQIVSSAIAGLSNEYKAALSALQKGPVSIAEAISPVAAAKTANKLVVGGLIAAGGLLLGKKLLSGNDDDHNTIEGMNHGWFGSQRKGNTDFGSGYKGPSEMVQSANPLYLHQLANMRPEDPSVAPEDQTPMRWGALATAAGAYGLYKYSFNKQATIFGKPIAVNSLTFHSVVPSGYDNLSSFLGRDTATWGDVYYSAIRRVEHSMGGLPKAFSVSTIMSKNILKDTTYSLDLTAKGSASYTKYLNNLTGIDLLQEGVTEVTYKQGKLFASKGSAPGRVLLKNAGLLQAVHDKNIVKSKAQFAKSYESIFGSAGIGRDFDLLITGGNSRAQALSREAHAYGHETLSKYLRLVDDPAKALRDVFPNISEEATDLVSKLTRMMPKLGVGGEDQLVGTLPQLLKRHARMALPALIGVPFAYGMVNWGVRQIAPEDSVAGRAGLTGIAAEAARGVHMTYAHLSDWSGLTSLRKSAEEQAPGMTGLAPFLGTAFSFGLTGALLGSAAGIAMEMTSKNSYAQFLANKEAIHEMPNFIKKIPGFGGKYGLTGKYARLGALVGGVMALPMLAAGLGSSKSAEELDQEYLQGKEVAVKKGRWWEMGMTPFEGGKTMYYRQNWYNRLLSGYKRKADYGDEDISPLGEFARTLADPYWKEKLHYDDRPFPIASASGEHLGIFSVLYERTLGQVLKPTAMMHVKRGWDEEQQLSWLAKPGMKTESGEQPISPSSAQEDIKQQFYNTYEAIGLRGFVLSSLKEAITGDSELYEQVPQLQSSSDIDNLRGEFWDLNLGGGIGLTEPLRRFMPNRPYTSEQVNNIKNTMPSWMPNGRFYIDFKKGDPYSKIPEGEYRLPGAGYAARYSELEGVNPEDYPLIHKYKILADVAMNSREMRAAEAQLRHTKLNDEEQAMFDEIQTQLEDKRQSRKFNFDEDYTGLFGRYTHGVASLAQQNPLEQLTPLSPAHKLLPQTDPATQYTEMVYGKEFKLWQNPVDDFIKPFLYSTGNLIGVDTIPTQVEEARKIEQYFDELQFVKFKRLEAVAGVIDNPGLGSFARLMQSKTLIGTDIFSEDFNVRVLPKRERAFFDAFKQMSEEDKDKVMSIAPENLKDIYQAQWDIDLMNKLESGQIEATEQEKSDVRNRMSARRAEISARRKAREDQIMNSPDLPSRDWVGWRANVDLEDVKLKYLLTNGKDFHYYDLWDDRLRKLRTRPSAGEAASQINPMAGLSQSGKPTHSDFLQWASNAGLEDPTIAMGSGVNPGVTLDAQYDNTEEENTMMRELGHVI